MPSTKQEKRARRKAWWGMTKDLVRVALGLAATMSLFCSSLWFISHSTLEGLKPATLDTSAGVLLTAASLALFVFSSLIAIAAIISWPGLKQHINLSVRESTDPKLKEIQSELRGRTYSNTGFALGELSLGKDTFQVERPALLDSAVESCWLGFLQLEEASDNPRLMALNNWLYFMTFQSGPPQKLGRRAVLEYANELEMIGRKHDAPRLQLTYCRAVACYETDPSERDRAKALLRNLAGKPSPYELREAQFCGLLFEDPQLPYKEG